MSIYHERRLTLSEAAQELGKNAATVWRWALKGCKGVKLETFVLGHIRYTSAEALERFAAACTAAADGQAPADIRTARSRRKAIAAAEAELANV